MPDVSSQEVLRATLPSETTEAVDHRVFLCHNNSDKPIVREIAEQIESEYGLANFLDVYSIPAGATFRPFIESELNVCTCCAIFLGGNGWGPTHLWEAELAVARYKADPKFKLIPVMLPGVLDSDIARLASGSVFRALNYVDFRGSRLEPDSIRKLHLALTGLNDGQISRRGLTPFILHRDTKLWHQRQRKDRSLLYSGAKLLAAQKLLETAAGLLDAGEVAAFVQAGFEAQRRFWRNVFTASSIAALALIIAGGVAFYQWRLAESRHLVAVSRGLALEADSARGVTQQLLIAANAVNVTSTATARAKLLAKLDQWRNLVATSQLRNFEFTAAEYRTETRSLLLGTSDGTIVEVPLKFNDDNAASGAAFLEAKPLLQTRGEGEVRAMVMVSGGSVLIGFQSGRVEMLGPDGRHREVRPAPHPVLTNVGAMKDQGVRSLAVSPTGDQIAMGDGRGVMEVRDYPSFALSFPAIDLSDQLRVNAVTFLGVDKIVAGTGSGYVNVFDARSGTPIAKIPKQGSEVFNVADIGDTDRFVEVTDEGLVRTMKVDAQQQAILSDPMGFLFQLPPMIVNTKIQMAGGAIAVGYPDGVMEVRDNSGSPLLDRMQPHSDQVGAFVFVPGTRLLVSAGRDGVLALWRLDGHGSGARPVSHFSHGSVDTLAVDKSGKIFAVSKGDDSASVWEFASTGWVQLLDLLDLRRKLTGELIEMSDRQPDDEGFVDVTSQPVENVVIAADAQLALWSTFDGMVFSSKLSSEAVAKQNLKAGTRIADLALSANGQLAAALQDSRTVVIFAPGSSIETAKREIKLNFDARSIGLSADAEKLAVGGTDGAVRFYDLQRASKKPLTNSLISSEIASVTFTPEDKSLVIQGATAGKDSRSLAIAETSLQNVRYLPMPDAMAGGPTSIAISRDGNTLAAADVGGNVLLWDLKERKSIGVSSLDGSQISALAFNLSNDVVATVSTGDNIVEFATAPSALTKRVCDLAGRDLDDTEWSDLETDLDYRHICRDDVALSTGTVR